MTIAVAVVGAGSVGLVLTARLARAGVDTLLVTRSEAQARAISAEGLRLEDPATEQAWRVAVPTAGGIAAAGSRLDGRTLLLCTRTGHTPGIAHEIAQIAPDAILANAQNGVEGDALLGERFGRVLGVVVRFTATRVGASQVRTTGRGRLIVGRHPDGAGPEADALAGALRRADFDAGLSERIADDRWLKLAINLLSAPNALIRREDHAGEAFVELKSRLLEEARDILAAAGIRAASCDGRDRSLEQEIAQQRASLAAGTSARSLPLYNQVWRALSDGGAVEADTYHRTFLELARRHGVPAPQNARMLEALEAATAPECRRASELLERS